MENAYFDTCNKILVTLFWLPDTYDNLVLGNVYFSPGTCIEEKCLKTIRNPLKLFNYLIWLEW